MNRRQFNQALLVTATGAVRRHMRPMRAATRCGST